MSRYRKFTMIAAVAALAFGLAACGSSDNDTADSTPPVVTPTPDPVPTDLEATQTAAAAAATAAMTASASAGTAADEAKAETMHIATLQTNGMAMGYATGAREAATSAMASYAVAKAASDAAAAATTGDAAEAAWRNAVAAKEAAEGEAGMAADMAMKAAEAAMTELHINGTMKNVAKGSLDASSGELRTPTAGGGLRITGLQIGSEPARATASESGVDFIQGSGPTGKVGEIAYKQAVDEGSVEIGKLLDTSDDKARLLLITSYEDKKTVRVFADDGNASSEYRDAAGKPFTLIAKNQKDNAVDLGAKLDANAGTPESIGLYYKAEPPSPESVPPPAPNLQTRKAQLDALDVVDPAGKGVEIFEISDRSGKAVPPVYARIVRTITPAGGTPVHYYKLVDIIADRSITDGGDDDPNPDSLDVTVSLPVATEYDHIHFGVWAGLGAAKKTGAQDLADLGIGFVQNIDGSGVTDRQGIGTATFNGDWVAAVRRQYASDAEAGTIQLYDGKATLTANFEDGGFKGALTGLATLEGTLADNGFSGVTAKAISHADLEATGKFVGEFSGGIYGPTGSEAAGVFDFDGGEAGAFRGAFGGAQ